MSEKVYPVPAEWAERAFVNEAKYKEIYARSVTDTEGFWRERAGPDRLDQAVHEGQEYALRADVSIKWYEDGTLNVAQNCLDRHLAERRPGRDPVGGR